MTITGNSYTVAQIDAAVAHVKYAISQLPEGVAGPATMQFLLELYLGSLDNTKEDNTQAARN